jgi:hypothetical protein
MSTERIFQGTWEEIAARAGVLAGRRMLVILLSDQTAARTPGESVSMEEEERLLDELAIGPHELPTLPPDADRREWIYGEHD